MKRTGTPLSFLRCSLKSIFLHPSWYKYNPYFADDTPSGEEIGMYVGYIYVMIQPFEIGFNKPYKAIRPIHMATTTRVTTLNLARKPCIVGSTFYSLSPLLRISFCPDQELLPLTTKNKQTSNQTFSYENFVQNIKISQCKPTIHNTQKNSYITIHENDFNPPKERTRQSMSHSLFSFYFVSFVETNTNTNLYKLIQHQA